MVNDEEEYHEIQYVHTTQHFHAHNQDTMMLQRVNMEYIAIFLIVGEILSGHVAMVR